MQRALPTFQRLVQEFASETEFKCVWVSFENLTTECVHHDASANAIKADMVIFSAETNEIPEHVREWVEGWLPRKNLSHSALVALIGTSAAPHEDITPAHRYLESVAARAAMDFLSEVNNSAGTESSGNESDSTRSLPDRWGINE